MTELIWDGKYKDGKKQGAVRIALPFQTVETVNESAQARQHSLELFTSGRDTEWRNRLIWGDKNSRRCALRTTLRLRKRKPPVETMYDLMHCCGL
jgi:hypothetical protein